MTSRAARGADAEERGGGGGGQRKGREPSKLESRRPRRGKQRTALIEARTRRRAHDEASRVWTHVSAERACARERTRASWRYRSYTSLRRPFRTSHRALSLPPSLSRGNIRIPVPSVKAETRGRRIPTNIRMFAMASFQGSGCIYVCGHFPNEAVYNTTRGCVITVIT